MPIFCPAQTKKQHTSPAKTLGHFFSKHKPMVKTHQAQPSPDTNNVLSQNTESEYSYILVKIIPENTSSPTKSRHKQHAQPKHRKRVFLHPCKNHSRKHIKPSQVQTQTACSCEYYHTDNIEASPAQPKNRTQVQPKHSEFCSYISPHSRITSLLSGRLVYRMAKRLRRTPCSNMCAEGSAKGLNHMRPGTSCMH